MKPEDPLVKPPVLREGDCVGLVAPSSPFQQDALKAGIRFLRDEGFLVRHLPDLLERATDLAESFVKTSIIPTYLTLTTSLRLYQHDLFYSSLYHLKIPDILQLQTLPKLPDEKNSWGRKSEFRNKDCHPQVLQAIQDHRL